MHQAKKVPEISEETKRKHTIRKPERTDGDPRVSSQELGYLEDASMEPTVENRAALLTDPRLSHPTNTWQKVRMLNQLQQHYGNAYVQEIVDCIQYKNDEKLSEEEPPDGITHLSSDEMVKEVFNFFYPDNPPEAINDKLRDLAPQLVKAALEQSKLIDRLPRPPGARPGIGWLVSQGVRILWRRIKGGQGIYNAVRVVVARNFRTAYELAKAGTM